MLAAIIKENDNKYYLNLEEKNNTKIISIVHTNKNKVKNLNEEEAISLLNTILSSKLTYKERKGKYDIYLDESNNKRFFKNGKEDFLMFFFNNGVSAIEYDNDNEEDEIFEFTNYDDEDFIEYMNNNKHNSKRFKITIGTLVMETILTLALAAVATYSIKPELIYKVNDALFHKNALTSNDIEDLISESKKLTDNDKEILNNDKLFEDVITEANETRDYILRVKLDDVEIENFDVEEAKKDHKSGYYNPSYPNVIYMSETIEPATDAYNDVLTHEFIHLLQDDNKYLYIHEACAEILSSEYYDTPEDTYIEEIKRVKILTEIIGPKPILACNFSEDNTIFEDAIKQYLNEEEAKEFLTLMTSNCDDFYEAEKEKEINDKVDKLLAKMYFNKTGKDINEDVLIRQLYIDNNIDRVYFNSEKAGYNEEFRLHYNTVELENIDFESLLNTDQVEKYTLYKRGIYTQEEYENSNENFHLAISSYEVIPELRDKVILSDNGQYLGYEYGGQWYSEKEAIEIGLVKKYYRTTTEYETTNYNDLEINPDDMLELHLKDGTIERATFNYVNEWESINHYQIIIINEPSIREKFKDQFEKEESKNIEILDMFENEKEEAKLETNETKSV